MNKERKEKVEDQFDKLADIYDDNLSELLEKYGCGGGDGKVCRV